MKLSLAIKFNLVFIAIFAIGLTAIGVVADRVLQQQALDETRHDADVLLRAAGAMQDYTAQHITPLLATQIKYSFVPESVPAYSAIEMLNTLQSAFRTSRTSRRCSTRPIRATVRPTGKPKSSAIFTTSRN